MNEQLKFTGKYRLKIYKNGLIKFYVVKKPKCNGGK